MSEQKSAYQKILLDESAICEIERIIRHGNKAEIKLEKENVVIVEVKRHVTMKRPT